MSFVLALLASIVLFGGTVLLFFPYIAFFFTLYVWFGPEPKKYTNAEQMGWMRTTIAKPIAMRVFQVYLAIHVVLFGLQLVKWCGPDNAHHEAKLIFAAGQVTAAQRKVFMTVLHPDNPLLWPLEKYQQLEYAIGSRFLPDGDGESGLWRNLWFYYPYTRKHKTPYGTGRKYINPPMVELLDGIWDTMEQINTQPIADPQMYREVYLTGFPTLASYYEIWDAFYLPEPKTGVRSERIILHPEYHRREKRLSDWLLALEAKWQQVPEAWDVIQQRPKILVARLMPLIKLHGHILRGQMLQDHFACDDPLLQRYLDLRRQLAGDDETPGVIDRISNQEERRVMYKITLQNGFSLFMKYAVQDFCHQPVAGRFFEDKEMKDNYFGRVYKQELAVIREATDG